MTIQTRKELLDALQRATSRTMSPSELHAQRVSFIMGSIKDPNTVTRAQVEDVLAKQEGKK